MNGMNETDSRYDKSLSTLYFFCEYIKNKCHVDFQLNRLQLFYNLVGVM